MTDKQPQDVDPELLSQAEQRFRLRFRHLDTTEPLVGEMLSLGMSWLPRDVDLFPEAYLSTKVPPPGQRLPVPSMKELAASATIPAMPQVLFELQRVINDSGSSATDMARVISSDPKLTAAVLRVANSPLFSFPSKVETVSRATALLGTKQISTLASGIILLSMFTLSNEAVNLERFWRHCIACGVLARELAVRLRLGDPEKYFVAGLLHDVGWLAIATCRPDVALSVRALCREEGELLTRAEQRHIPFDHAAFGAFLLKKWNFPLRQVGGVAFHHDTKRGAKWEEPQVLHVANFLANGLGLSINVDVPVEPLQKTAWKYLKLEYFGFDALLHEAEQQMDETFDSFGFGF